MKALLKFMLLLLLLCGAAIAQQKNVIDVYEAAKSGDKAALQQLTTMAIARNSEAQFYLGFMYYTGDGLLKDVQQAVTWFRKAAEQGFASAVQLGW